MIKIYCTVNKNKNLEYLIFYKRSLSVYCYSHASVLELLYVLETYIPCSIISMPKIQGFFFSNACLLKNKKDRKRESNGGRERESGKTRNYITISKISHTVIPFNSTVVQIYNRAIQICKTSAYVTTELHNAFCCTSPNYFKN